MVQARARIQQAAFPGVIATPSQTERWASRRRRQRHRQHPRRHRCASALVGIESQYGALPGAHQTALAASNQILGYLVSEFRFELVVTRKACAADVGRSKSAREQCGGTPCTPRRAIEVGREYRYEALNLAVQAVHRVAVHAGPSGTSGHRFRRPQTADREGARSHHCWKCFRGVDPPCPPAARRRPLSRMT